MPNIKKFLFQLNHPAHFHLFKNTIDKLKENGHDVLLTVKNKDILKDLLVNYEYVLISGQYRKNKFFSILKNVYERDKALFKIVKDFKPDLMLGTSPEIGHIRKFVGANSIFFGEDDVGLTLNMYLGALTAYPFFDSIISPNGCNNSIWKKKTAFYDGYQKLAYLHPNRFVPQRDKVKIPIQRKIFILRFANLSAYHDINATGINNDLAKKLIDQLKPYGEVLITSERELPNQFEKYRFKGNLLDMHHYLYYAELYIGDSQSMAVESAVLGTPGIRFNDFAGKINVLEELEHKYGLTRGLKTNQVDDMFSLVASYLNNPGLKEEYAIKRQRMLQDKIDVTSFFLWFIENYPDSKKIMKENKNYQYTFR